jgi:hypothetical protein
VDAARLPRHSTVSHDHHRTDAIFVRTTTTAVATAIVATAIVATTAIPDPSPPLPLGG